MISFVAKRFKVEPQSSVALWTGPGLTFPLYCLEPGLKREPHPGIPLGIYPLHLRTVGGFHTNYQRYYDNKVGFGPGWHQGMIEIDKVPGRDFILLHVGNYLSDTLGCSLAGSSYGKAKDGRYQVSNSRAAYERAYPVLRDAILSFPVQLHVVAGELST